MFTKKLSKLALATFGLTLGFQAMGAETWQGRGQVKNLDNQTSYRFEITLTETDQAEGQKVRHVAVSWPGGGFEQACTVRHRGDSWQTTCSDGSQGGGKCLAYGLCQEYLKSEAGHAFAMTIVMDGVDGMRLLTTELDAIGNPLRFYSQQLTRLP